MAARCLKEPDDDEAEYGGAYKNYYFDFAARHRQCKEIYNIGCWGYYRSANCFPTMKECIRTCRPRRKPGPDSAHED